MKLTLETKKGTKYRENELNKLKNYLEQYYYGIEEGPFYCYYQCENFKEGCKNKCIEEYVKNIIKKIDKEGELYL